MVNLCLVSKIKKGGGGIFNLSVFFCQLSVHSYALAQSISITTLLSTILKSESNLKFWMLSGINQKFNVGDNIAKTLAWFSSSADVRENTPVYRERGGTTAISESKGRPKKGILRRT